MICQLLSSFADRMSFRTGSIWMLSLVGGPNKKIGASNPPGAATDGSKDWSAPTAGVLPSAIHARPVAASNATPQVRQSPPEKNCDPVAVAVRVVIVAPLMT